MADDDNSNPQFSLFTELGLPKTKDEAIASGSNKYFTGIPCRRGHICPRTIKGQCILCRDEMVAEWHKKHPDKSNEWKKRWKKNNPEYMAAYRERFNAERRKPEGEPRKERDDFGVIRDSGGPPRLGYQIDGLPATKQEARAMGLMHYYTGKPCRRGHLSRRLVSGACQECLRITSNESRRRNPERHREKVRQRLAARRIRKAFEIAGTPRPDRCDVCQSIELVFIDHSHETGKFRGWLCRTCNLAVGHAKDSAKLLRQLADYLER